MTNAVTLSVPRDLVELAKERGINISLIARMALAEALKSEKQESGIQASKP